MNQLSLVLDQPRARRRDPSTSHKAADRAKTFAPSHSQRILEALTQGDLTANEISIATGLTVVQVCRRLPEISGIKPLDIEREGFRVWSAAA
jgi:hypothetical protein